MKFDSITREHVVYEYKKTTEYGTRDGQVSDDLWEYSTLGDGNTQHTASSHVWKDNALDVMSSWAKFLSENRDTWDELDSYGWRQLANRDEVKFFMSLKYNEDKPAYFSATDLKKSTAASKEFDKRWQTVPRFADGSLEAVYTFLCKAYYTYLDRIRLFDQIRETIRDLSECCYPTDSQKHFQVDLETWRNLTGAINIVGYAYDAVKAEANVKSAMSCLDNNYISRLTPDSKV